MKSDDILLWLAALIGGLAMAGARLGWLLFRVAPAPPAEVAALNLWKRKRQWLIVSELSALPAFALISILVGRSRDWPIEGVIGLSMVLGALGFAFFLDALQTIIRRRMGIDSHG